MDSSVYLIYLNSRSGLRQSWKAYLLGLYKGLAGHGPSGLDWGKPKTAGFGAGKSLDLSEVLHVSTKVRLVSGIPRR
jgi:hypothetical protein